MTHNQRRLMNVYLNDAEQREAVSKSWEVTSILWNGGWDDLLVDPSQVYTLTDEEAARSEANVKAGRGLYPFVGAGGSWLLVYFIKNYYPHLDPRRQAIKIIRGLGSGD